MKLLLLHGWLRGNLGDFVITNLLASFLRGRFPDATMTLVTEPSAPWRIPAALTSVVDRVVERSFRETSDDLIADASAVIQVPGGGFQEEDDARAPFMLRDAETCHRLGIPHILAGHSFHPAHELSRLQGSLVIAREPRSFDVLASHGVPAVLSADPAFLLSAPKQSGVRTGTTVFLRRWHIAKAWIEGSLFRADHHVVHVAHEPITLASSDPLRDDAFLVPLQRRYGLFYERCFDLPHLLSVIGGSAHVVSDRYHPVIFAAMTGVPFTFLPRHGSPRDAGLLTHLQDRSLPELAALARSGLASVGERLRGCS